MPKAVWNARRILIPRPMILAWHSKRTSTKGGFYLFSACSTSCCHPTQRFWSLGGSVSVSLQAPEEIDQCCIDLRGPLLLRPVTAAREHDCLPQMRHKRR